MGECLVDEVKIDTLWLVITIDCLQTGDVAYERRSCQTAENNDAVSALQFLSQGKGITFLVESGDIGEGFTLQRHGASFAFG
jgi:hypothetical protein